MLGSDIWKSLSKPNFGLDVIFNFKKNNELAQKMVHLKTKIVAQKESEILRIFPKLFYAGLAMPRVFLNIWLDNPNKTRIEIRQTNPLSFLRPRKVTFTWSTQLCHETSGECSLLSIFQWVLLDKSKGSSQFS